MSLKNCKIFKTFKVDTNIILYKAKVKAKILLEKYYGNPISPKQIGSILVKFEKKIFLWEFFLGFCNFPT